MNIQEALVEACGDDDLLFADGLDDAIIGWCHRAGQPTVVVYERALVLGILVESGLTEEEAIEHYEYNVVGGWVGPRTPCFVERMT